ncbi:5'-3' exoribonuclease 1 isoform X2 [Belonocnema kinseyi]|uniref:5'-3' exoribonuclease 1 isoform X2 n=1 Tax=Belonocnema kinseyi TaxID=2817044 RepID=UPI00143DE8AE|nr:5'-3' exoribonuclease 1 isoform X2 [Belonocnema kinseyi]
MGVPKFFRYISERYPCLSEKLKEYQIPEFDNLYLDMNGIIHGCSHPNDADVQFRITEENIFKNIFHYIEILFRMIQPQKVFFMAVDGVAPRAKINQQRGRRFRSAKEAEVLEKKAQAKGIDLPNEARFDSNCITPGTLFMAKLTKQLKYFITYKISTDKLWQKCKVVLSGSEVPGEGEHKIMDYIRYMKAQPDHDPNTRHCLYGLDADLIMLGLCTHEPHFSLLREEVVFGKKQKKVLTPEENNFCLLHLSLMREYLEHEFSPIKQKLPFEFDIEKIIDDWVLMGFLVGNDFIPNLPNLHINQGALPILYNVYMEVLPTLTGYINEAGTLNLERFEKFMERLSLFDVEQFGEAYADLKYFEGKTGRRPNELERHSYKNSEDSSDTGSSPTKPMSKALASLIKATEDSLLGNSDEDEDPLDVDSDEEIYNLEFVQHKRDYYMNKMEYENVDEQFLRSQAEGYVRAIQWNLHYYYNGCCSWSWYYPHHYAPYISDIRDFKDLKLEFDMGEPFFPFQQLLAVLPAASKALLPKAYQNLLTQSESPIIDYYPLDFKTDLNGKRQEWEAVVLIPFIDETQLINAMEPYNAELLDEERERNKHGPMCIFTYTDEDMGFYSVPEYFPSINSHAKCQLVNRDDILVPEEKLVKCLCPGVKLSVYFPGFPTLQHIEHTVTLEKAKVKVFEQPSRGENMILHVVPKPKPDLEAVAEQILGQSVFVGWPHLLEALVVAVSDDKWKIHVNSQSNKKSDWIKEAVDGPLTQQKQLQQKAIAENYKNRLGVDIGNIHIIVHTRLIVGRKYIFGSQGRLTLEKEWSDVKSTYAHHVILKDITVHDGSFVQYSSATEIFKPKSICFMLGHPHYGAMGEVNEPGMDAKTGRVKVAMRILPEPNLEIVKQKQRDTRLHYMHGSKAAQHLGISSHLLSKITGTIFVMPGSATSNSGGVKHNVGLNLKFNKRNEEVPGFTRKENGQWLYSTKAIDLLRGYMQKCPGFFEELGKNVGSELFFADELFGKGTEKIDEVVAWLKDQQEKLNIESRTCGTETLETDIVTFIEKEVDTYLESVDTSSKTVFMQVKPHLLFKPGLNAGYFPPDAKAEHKLFDRIVIIRESFTVPMGYKGTIVGIQKGEKLLDNMYEIVFDKSFVGGLVIHGCSKNRGYRLSVADFINISYGLRVELGKSGKADCPLPESWRSNIPQSQPRGNVSAFATFNNQGMPSGFAKHSETISPFSQVRGPRGEPQAATFYGKSNFNAENKMQSKTPLQHGVAGGFSGHGVKIMSKPMQPAPKSQQQFISKQSSEFQALWNELQKSSNSPKPSALPAGDKPKQRIDVKAPSHAREAEKKREGLWYSSRLMSYFQVNCNGIPRYNYIPHKQNNLVCAQIILPDMRAFCGDFQATVPEATESAAKKVYEELQLDKMQKPRISMLAQPPQQWYNTRFNNVNNVRPAPIPPQNPQLGMNPPMWNQPPLPTPNFVSMPPRGNMPGMFPQGFPHPPPGGGVFENWRTSNKQQDAKRTTPFVPLQAQKQNRNVNKPGHEKRQKELGNKESFEKKGQQNLKENTQKKPKEEKAALNRADDKKNASHNSQKSQKSGNQRKSRIAANFGSAPLPNGEERK